MTLTVSKSYLRPYIFILDLDGTIIGDCSYQCEIYNIQEIIRKNIAHSKQQADKIKLGARSRYRAICEQSLHNCYSSCSKLIRPYFHLFISKMKKLFPHSYFFIYTASEKTWALKEIAIIERQNKIKFNRPIFTRNDCLPDSQGNLRKSVAKILPMICKTIKCKTPDTLKNQIIVIDNNPTFIDYTDNLLVCPTYNYLQFKNLWENIPHDYDKIEELKRYVQALIANKKIHMRTSANTDAIKLEKIHRWLYRKYKRINKNNAPFENDTFWKDLFTHIHKLNIKEFNKKTVSILQKSLAKEYTPLKI